MMHFLFWRVNNLVCSLKENNVHECFRLKEFFFIFAMCLCLLLFIMKDEMSLFLPDTTSQV